jgi:sugar phosphate isomerase/epimerase
MKRRTFLGGAAALALSSNALADILRTPFNTLPANNPYLETLGLQLYTVRNELEMDKEATLKAVKDAGYHQVELMNTMDSDEIVTIARDLGLNVTSAFFNWETVANPNENAPTMETVIEKANEIGLKHLVFGYIGPGHRESVEHFKAHADSASIAGEKCLEAGIQLCYHNHSFEFKPLEDDVTGFDLFIERFHRDFVKFELDVFWSQIGGWDALRMLDKLDGRVTQVHLKDLKKGTKKEYDEGNVAEKAFQPLGRGSINMKKVIAKCKEIGVEQCHVEQDQSPSPIEEIGVSYVHMQEIATGKAAKEPKPKKPKKDKVDDKALDDPFGG